MTNINILCNREENLKLFIQSDVLSIISKNFKALAISEEKLEIINASSLTLTILCKSEETEFYMIKDVNKN